MIDWNGELEAYHVDGRVVPSTVSSGPDAAGDYVTEPDIDGQFGIWHDDGTPWQTNLKGREVTQDWRIRNRSTQSQPTPEQEAVALVHVIAMAPNAPWHDEARRIVARMEPEVDPIIIQARKIALSHSLPALINGMTSWKVGQGEADDKPYMKAIVDALCARNEGEKT